MSSPGLPADINRVLVQGQFLNLRGEAQTGQVTFTPNLTWTIDAANKQVITGVPITAPLDATGSFSIYLPCTDDTDLNPTIGSYMVVDPAGRAYNMLVPVGSGTIDLSQVVPAGPSTPGVVQVLTGPTGPAGSTTLAGLTDVTTTGAAIDDLFTVATVSGGAMTGAKVVKPSVPISKFAPVEGTRHRAISVVVYHEVNAPAFQTDLDWFQEWNYTPITCDQLANFLDGTGTLPEKPLMITFDDGYVSQYDAASALHDRGMVGIFYITSGWIDGTITGPSFGATGTVATWSQIQQMYAWGHDIQSHTVSHPDMQTLTPTQVSADFTAVKARIETQVPGANVKHMAYPFGSWKDETKTALRTAGCRTARVVRIGTDGAYPGPNMGRFAYATTLNDPLAIPCAGPGSALTLYQANAYHKVARDEQLVPDYAFTGGGKGWTLAAGATIDTTDAPTGFTRCVRMPQQATSVQTETTRPIYIGNFASVEIEVWIKTEGMGSVFGRLNLVLLKSDGQTTYTSLGPVPGVQQTGTNGWTKYTATYFGDHNVVFARPQLYVQTSGTPTGVSKFAGLSIRKSTMAPTLPAV